MSSLHIVTEREAVAQVRGFAAANRYRLTDHAIEEMDAAGATFEDVHSALCRARSARYQADRDSWRVAGPDRLGEVLALVVKFEDDMIVITIW
jgi:hypothetical protein